MNNLTQYLDYINKATAGTLLAVVLFTSYSGVWVWGKDYATLAAERDEWKDLALKAVKAGEGLQPRAIGMTPPAAPHSIDGVRARVRGLEAVR